jgi:DNA mismatch repair protein MutS2
MTLNLLDKRNYKNLELLDWPEILERITSRTHFEKSREILSSPFGPKDKGEIEFSYDSLNYLLQDLTSITDTIYLYLGKIPRSKKYFYFIDGLKKGKMANIEELNFACLLLESYTSLKRSFGDWNLYPGDKIDPLVQKNLTVNFVGELRSFVEPSGEVHYERHPLLAKIYSKLKKLEGSLREEIGQIAASPLYANSLQYSEHDVINDRYVLAIRSDSYNKNHGPIVAKSSSGLTLFVEPTILVTLGNHRMQLLAELDEIFNRITQEFSLLLHSSYEELKVIRDFTIDLDITFSKAIYCHQMEFCRPKILNDFEIKTRDFFHPLITNPVKNDLDIFKENNGIILSGPNTGGKTVTLKSLALCHIFVHFGIFIPAEIAELYPVKNIFFFSNDQQNLAEGLSSFSSEVKNYITLLKDISSTENNLIFIDEIFNSTSSEEGSALGIALLEEIHALGPSKVLISTHHQVFKTYFHKTGNYLSAHVGFDEVTEGPTYKIETGSPGSSMALSIFGKLSEKFGVKGHIKDRAMELIDREKINYEGLLQELTIKKSRLDSLLLENNTINLNLKAQEKSQIGLLKLEKEKLWETYNLKLKKLIDRADKALKKEGRKTFYKESSSLKQELRELDPNIEKKEKGHVDLKAPNLEDIKVGDFYFSKMLRAQAEVLNINCRKKEIQIKSKNITLWCPVNSLGILKEIQAPETTVRVKKEVLGKIELDCRGMRLEEFEAAVEKSLGELLTGDIPFLKIIHGHGEGVLKKWLRNYLKNNEDFDGKPDDENDGITRIDLKNSN